MDAVTLDCAQQDKVNAHATGLAAAMGRGAPNIEDQLSAALSLLSGLQILQHADALAWEAAIDKVLGGFMRDVLATEKGIRDGLERAPPGGGASSRPGPRDTRAPASGPQPNPERDRRRGGCRQFLRLAPHQALVPRARYGHGDLQRQASCSAHREPADGRHPPAARMEGPARAVLSPLSFTLAGYDHGPRLSRVCRLACSPRKGLVAKRQWYCQIGRKRRARAETADWRTKVSPATRCDDARLQSPGDTDEITPRWRQSSANSSPACLFPCSARKYSEIRRLQAQRRH